MCTQNGSSYTNLVQHIATLHPLEMAAARRSVPCDGGRGLAKIIISPEVVSMHVWLSYVIYCLHPFSALQHGDVNKHVKYENICLNTFKIYMDRLTKQVGLNIRSVLPEKTRLMFDGWNTRGTPIIWQFLRVFSR